MKLSKLTDNLGCLSCKFNGLGHTYGNFPENQELPYVSYRITDTNQIGADGRIIYSEDNIEMQVMTTRRDLALEKAIEDMLSCEHVTYQKSYDVDAEQKIHTVSYTFACETEV